jgi:hypothetical protein
MEHSRQKENYWRNQKELNDMYGSKKDHNINISDVSFPFQIKKGVLMCPRLKWGEFVLKNMVEKKVKNVLL